QVRHHAAFRDSRARHLPSGTPRLRRGSAGCDGEGRGGAQEGRGRGMKRWVVAMMVCAAGFACGGGDGGTGPGHGPGGLSVSGELFGPLHEIADAPGAASFTAGDELPIHIQAISDAPFQYLGYEVGGPQGFSDSVLVPFDLQDADTLVV